MVNILGAAMGAIGGLMGGGGGNPLGQLQQSQDKALQQTAAMNAMTAEFQSNMEALKAVSEAMNAKHRANMDTLSKVGQAGG